MAKPKPRFRVGDIITNGQTYLTVQHYSKDSYKFTNGEWMPINVVDAFWWIPPVEWEIED
jgi:hypothetical protein